MSRLRFLFGQSRLLWGCALVAFLFSAPSAHANTYLFSFTTAQLEGALDAVDTNHLQDGFFAIFLQVPDGYTAVQENSPDPTGSADWVATTESYSPFLNGTWIEFARDDSKTDVTLVSDANGGTGSMFLGQTYSDGGSPAPPISFGTTPGTITSIMASAAVFSFELIGATDPGSLTFNGKASAIESSSLTAFTGAKTTFPNNFTMTITDTGQVPEPATFIPFGLGAAWVMAAGVLRKKKTGAGSRS